MSEIKVNSIKGVGASAAAITVNNTDGTCTANITSVGGSQLANRNKVINGGMTISQRNGTSAVQLSASEQYIVDRFKNDTGSSFDMKADASQSTDHPDGFSNSLKLVCDGVSSPGTDGNGGIATFIEGQDVQDFGFGSSNAKTMTLSFYAKSAAQNANDTYSVMVGYSKDGSAARVKQTRSFTVTASWQRFTMTFQPTGVAQSSGITNSTAYGVQIFFSLAAGSNDLISEITTWTEAAPLVGVTGQNNFFDASGNELYITGVQLEVGSVATDFEHKSFAQELALCQRYFYNHVDGTVDGSSGANTVSSNATFYTNSNVFASIQFPVQMRTKPTLEVATGTNFYGTFSAGSSLNKFTGSSMSFDGISNRNQGVISNSDASGSGGNAALWRTDNTGAKISFNAEL